MVFTCAVHSRPSSLPGLSRRATLAAIAAAAAITVAGCTKAPVLAKPSATTIATDPLGPLYEETTRLISTYDQSMATVPGLINLLGPLREDHRQHANALASLMGIATPAITAGPMPSASTPAAPPPSASLTGSVIARAALADAEKSAQASATLATMSAPADRVAVLASIAACRATHVAVLR